MQTSAENSVQSVMDLLPVFDDMARTRLYISKLLTEMINAKTEQAGWRIRSELQGILNCLELQGVITNSQLESLGNAIGSIWTPLARKFATDRLDSSLKEIEEQM